MASDRRRTDRGIAEPPKSARELAIRVLFRVAERGAYASRALDAELARAGLDPRDEALATEIVYGTLRVLLELDQKLARHLKRPLASQDPLLRASLRAGAYQLFHLSRMPAHAVVDESVGAVRNARGRELAGVANAVLRKLAADAESAPEALSARAIVLPAWLERSLRAALGDERRDAWLASSLPPPLCLRVKEPRDRDALARELAAARPRAEIALGRVSHAALLLRRAGDPRALPGYAAGRFAVQEEGAQAIAFALGVEAGEAIADVCAGHGGKTALLASAIGANGKLVALDLDERKLERIPEELARLGLGERDVRLHPVDASVGTGGLAAEFDRVLVDAPCSGLGTIRRRPELLLRVGEHDPERFATLQLAILCNAARLVRPSGVLCYAVCSPTRAEGLGVVERFEAETPDFARIDAAAGAAGLTSTVADADGLLRLGPWQSGPGADSPDVYQVARWHRRSPA